MSKCHTAFNIQGPVKVTKDTCLGVKGQSIAIESNLFKTDFRESFIH